MVSAGVAIVVVANLVLVAVGIVAASLLLRRDADGTTATDWRQEAAGLVSEVREACESRTMHAEDTEVGRRFLPLASRLRSHARAAPAGVDGRRVEQLHELGTACHTLGVEYSPSRAARTGVFLADRIERLDADAAAFLEGLPEASQEPC